MIPQVKWNKKQKSTSKIFPSSKKKHGINLPYFFDLKKV
ncbi:hypothetical protein RV17_GL000226 [Enterococcus thailandicus]|nr:hypothetical protein RV17_GL000226 [Enterococcus thailandicus]